MDATRYVAALDQGTTSTRCIVFDHAGRVVSVDQREHEQIMPRAGWVEHDPTEILRNARAVVEGAVAKAGLEAKDFAALGITNQRETAVVWDRASGEPVYNAIVWQDTRTDKICAALGDHDTFRAKTGLPPATYFSGPKIKWILDHVGRDRDVLVGTIDTWLLWNLAGVHATDPTNASRTLLMDLDTLAWDPDLAAALDVPLSVLPEIRSSSEVFGHLRDGVLAGVPIAGMLGDQQAATFGQACLSPGEAKNTYGTGNFVLLNTGTEKVVSHNGLLTTVCYQLGGQDPVYALEGSIAVTGSLVQWLRDNLGIISSAAEIEEHARTVEDNGGVYFVPAFSGLFAPYWRSDARGVIVGLTRFVNRGHLARAVLESTAYQTREVIDAMNADSGVGLTSLKVDGGMVVNELLMQFQADILGVPTIRPVVNETTALGAAYAAGLAVGHWESEDDVRANWAQDKRWDPMLDPTARESLYRTWKKAVTRTFDWVD
ncbi:glycerol kinase GlpK [Saccharothrix violaceirubra]|uniref:Glycerol kinase n=1 Tax=Saccharothrix violaceirubra TaxID=413306 RepID=A0A7W7SY85_9PSEU|nr:glycerol kinase GlpK [Saccharothrix violaceirubra]MBB4963104.1 glycerol kinase [Saccharothrix violaceirubra]